MSKENDLGSELNNELEGIFNDIEATAETGGDEFEISASGEEGFIDDESQEVNNPPNEEERSLDTVDEHHTPEQEETEKRDIENAPQQEQAPAPGWGQYRGAKRQARKFKRDLVGAEKTIAAQNAEIEALRKQNEYVKRRSGGDIPEMPSDVTPEMLETVREDYGDVMADAFEALMHKTSNQVAEHEPVAQQPQHDQQQPANYDQLYEFLDSQPEDSPLQELGYWADEDPAMLEKAKAIEKQLTNNPEFKNHSAEALYLEVVERTKQQAQAPQAVEEKPVQQAAEQQNMQQVPASLSDGVGSGGSQAPSLVDQFNGLSSDKVDAWMNSLSSEQKEAFEAQLWG